MCTGKPVRQWELLDRTLQIENSNNFSKEETGISENKKLQNFKILDDIILVSKTSKGPVQQEDFITNLLLVGWKKSGSITNSGFPDLKENSRLPEVQKYIKYSEARFSRIMIADGWNKESFKVK